VRTLAELKAEALANKLRRETSAEVRFDPVSRKLYSTDASIYQIEPLGVVVPRTVADLQAAVQIAAEFFVPITARGGGTSLSGQSIGPGLILDCSKYLHRVLDIDTQRSTVRVQPGVVLDQLNRCMAPLGLQFGPDVATANRANLGGMIGNNSAGSRSIVYGKTLDHVSALRVILADGTMAELATLTHREWEERAAKEDRLGQILRHVRETVLGCGAEIEKRFPRILRRVSGYNLDTLWHSLRPGATTPINLCSLVVGSEGTLAVIAEAELKLVPRPAYRGLVVPHFDSLEHALRSLSLCLAHAPSAVELLDRMILDLARDNLALQRHMQAIEGRPACLFLVEISGASRPEVEERMARLARELRKAPGVYAVALASEPQVRDQLWNLRSAGLPLLLGLPGDRKPVTFVEDTAVAPENLPDFVARFRDILQRHGTDGAFYGHASVGCLHIRPLLNLKDPADVRRMRQIMEDITDLVLEYGGALSGEHGDGLARSEWNRKMFGPVIYEAFRRIKYAFDPHGLLNPGKVVDAAPMTEHLRYGAGYRPWSPDTHFTFEREQGILGAIELCNGSGVCRKTTGGTMCPSFRATRDEKDSTRGRANALRLALAGPRPQHDVRSPWLFDVLDLCLMCKACKAECPSNVDMARLKAEFLAHYYARRRRPVGQKLMAALPLLYRWLAPLAPLINWLQKSTTLRIWSERILHLDRRRTLPVVHRYHLRRWFAQHEQKRTGPPVLLLADCFTTYLEPHIGQAAVRLLQASGYTVVLAPIECCGRTWISKGYLDRARRLADKGIQALAHAQYDGIPIVGIEPSCLLTLADEWPELIPRGSPRCALARRVARRVHLLDHWLAERWQQDPANRPVFAPAQQTCVVHAHCHQKALVGAAGTQRALMFVPGLRVEMLDAGCCGMAGSFGYECEHYELSVRIAELELMPALRQYPRATIVASGTSCRHQIHDLLGRQAVHPLEVLADHLHADDARDETEASSEPVR